MVIPVKEQSVDWGYEVLSGRGGKCVLHFYVIAGGWAMQLREARSLTEDRAGTHWKGDWNAPSSSECVSGAVTF